MNHSLTLAVLLSACSGLTALAGTPAAAPAATTPAPVADASLLDTIGATLEVGYDTRYYHRGLWLADNMTWAGLNVQVPLTEKLTLGFGALYTSTVQTLIPDNLGGDTELNYSELDLSTSLTYDFGFVKAGLVYTHYEYLDTFFGSTGGASWGDGEGAVRGVNEVGLTLAKTVGPVNLYAGFYYDFTIGGSYFEVGADMPYKVTSWMSVVPAIKMGYGLDYYTNGLIPVGAPASAPSSGFTHILPSLSVPIKLTPTVFFTPYIAYNISLGARHGLNTQDSEFFGGVKLSVSF
jgi:hypothetical protein